MDRPKTAPVENRCPCGAPLIVSRIPGRRFVAVCSRPCIETVMSYGDTETDAVSNYKNIMIERRGKRGWKK